MKLPVGPAAAYLLVASVLAAPAQESPRVKLTVIAEDSAGKPVTDLDAADFTVRDNGLRQKIVSLRRNQSHGPRPLVILFDLLNSSFDSRGAVLNMMKTALRRLPSGDPLYLYLLVEDGSLYAVHGLAGDQAAGAGSGGWPRDAESALDDAMRKVNQVKPQDFRAASPIALPSRFDATCKALEDMRTRMEEMPGSKALLWVTYGFPSQIRMAGQGWWDGGPLLRQVGSRFLESRISIYTADPGTNPERGMLNRDALDTLAGATGGRTFSTIDINQARDRIEADARGSYTIEYEPSQGWDGKYHKLRVTVARKGVRLQTERGYFGAVL
ncbi:MAG TPA: VWA domain-containing protein [Bryobacteraceae bacterium]|nr:VWA domain-containing protein [Bryobacteraceae bacterium]